MKKNISMIGVACLLAPLLLLTGCAEHQAAPGTRQSYVNDSTVIVQKGSITPTVSAHAQIVNAVHYVVSMPSRGTFHGSVTAGENLKAGATLGVVNGKAIQVPVDSTVVSVTQPSSDIPANYPIAELEYTGFGIPVDASVLIRRAAQSQLRGRFQVVNGIGPSDCVAIVTVAGEGQSSGSGRYACLIDKSLTVNMGQDAIVVLTAIKKDNILMLPVSAVAGRIQKGQVNKLSHGKVEVVDVVLGITDGGNIEIKSGLAQGDKVLSIPPNLDPRGN